MIKSTTNNASKLLFFLAGAATTAAVGFVRRVRKVKRLRHQAVTHAPVERLDNRGEISALSPFPPKLLPLEEMIRTLSTATRSYCVLLSGPKGVGKTYKARAFAAHSGFPAFYVRVSSLKAATDELSQKRVKDLTERIEEIVPAVLILDELELLLSGAQEGRENQSAFSKEFESFFSDLPRGLLLIAGSREGEELQEKFHFDTVIRLETPALPPEQLP